MPQVQMLSEQGVKELTLLGQNVNSYTDSSTAGTEPTAEEGDPFDVYAKAEFPLLVSSQLLP